MFADLHCDTFYECFVKNLSFNNDLLHINFKSVSSIRPYIQTFAHYIPESINTTEDKFLYFQKMIFNTLKIIENSDEFVVFKSYSDIEKAEREGKILAVLSVEGGDFFCGNPASDNEKINFLKSMNIKFLSLCYNSGSDICGGCNSLDKNIDAKALEISKLLNDVGIFIDISHLNMKSAHALIDANIKVIATHSNCNSVCNHKRNLDDYCISKLIESNSLIGINMYAPFVSAQKADVSKLIKHINHVCELGGADNLAFGCDFDGCSEFPKGINCPADVLLLQNYSSVPKGMFYNNIKNFLKNHYKGN